MKKKLLILFTIIMTFTLCGCGAKEESNLVELTFDELTKKVEFTYHVIKPNIKIKKIAENT